MQDYLKNCDEVLKDKEASKKGITTSDAEERLLKYGKNILDEGKKKTLPIRILEQIKDPMILVLISAAIVSSFHEIADAVIIIVVVAVNTILGIFQESKAEKAIDALQKMSSPRSKVRRSGIVQIINSSDIAIGDIVLIEAGDSVPADIRLIETATLKIEEAALTGESLPVEKSSEAIKAKDKEVPLGDRVNMAYMGTSVSYGRGEGVVVGTGMNTEMGKIANMLSKTKEEKTPLQKKLSELSKILSFAVLGICLSVFILMVTRSGGDVLNALLISVSLAVAAIPEGLVVVVTVLLSIGVTYMSNRNAIIRRLTAVETLGAAEVICSDKTGTLTENKMTVVDYYGEEKFLATAVALCNDAKLDNAGNSVGDPTEIALVEFARKIGLYEIYEEYSRIGEAPFDSVRKMMSTVHQLPDGKIIQFTKGAPDEILRYGKKIYKDGKVIDLTDELRLELSNENKRMADKALRVIGGAYREYTKPPLNFSPESLETDLIIIGLTGMIDPIRQEVKGAVEKCKTAGIRAVMITGDHKDTAVAIAKELGILEKEHQGITGSDLSLMSDEEFEKRVSDISVYARVQPEHKVRIVNMWKKKGKIAAMTGDGVNDAPALKAADIGIGMGITGTDVTKNVADMVLSDDNFATIIHAVEEGRRIYANIKKSVQFLLSSNLSEVVSILIATLLGWTIFAPIHILWINLITDSFPAMALGMETAEDDTMKNPPRSAKESIFAKGMGTEIIWQGMLIGLLTLFAFTIGRGADEITGMTMAFLTLSLCEVFHSFNMRSQIHSIFRIKGCNKFLLGAMLLSLILTFTVIYVPGLNTLFKLTPLSIHYVLIAFLLSFSIIPVVEIYKIFRKKVTIKY